MYDQDMHKQVEQVHQKTPGLSLIYQGTIVNITLIQSGMEVYLDKKDGKKFHDPLAASAALNPSICKWKQVRMMHERREWYCNEDNQSHIFIAVFADLVKFVQTLMSY